MKMTLRSIAPAALFAAVTLAPVAAPDPVLGSGGGIHLVVSEVVLKKKSVPDGMKKVISLFPDWYKTGSIEPDVFYNSSRLTKNEAGHNGEFFTEFLKLTMNERCGSPGGSYASADCGKNLAFLLGALSHISEDAIFDESFVGKGSGGVMANCPGIKKAETFTDTDLDICVAKMTRGAVVPCDERSEFKGGDSCYTCPGGSARTVLPANGGAACEDFKKPEKIGDKCEDINPKGWGKSFGDPNGRCYSCPDSAPNRNPLVGIKDAKACYKTAVVGPFKSAKETRGTCSAPDFMAGGKCYSCDGYKHNVLFNVGDKRACSKLIAGDYKRKVDMCQIKDFASLGVSGAGYLPLAMQLPKADLIAAYARAGTNVPEDALSKELESRWATFGQEHLAGFGNFEEKVLECSWGFDNLVKGKGGMDDSANSVADFLTKVWGGIGEWGKSGNAVVFERSGRKYTVKQSGAVIATVGK